ncbi:coiled-coil domain-containing protein 112-like isoform X4 [Centruroides sculpturatus]|uniref:coiled-coil domain-containing protein 112-like isoform X4 n=1 Tax=Centruroides sculpturatus TaxID=218467 RepID=UPI000C6CA303|nr:coiled-coil domain-containing protein 112-like isoform X4 [Centruroides sculpturatus]
MGRPLGEGQGPKYSGLTSHKKFRWSCSSRFYHGFTERLNSKERKDIIENYLKYKQKIKQVETELHNYLLNSKLLDVELKTLMENDNILQLKRITSYNELRNKITRINENIKILSEWLPVTLNSFTVIEAAKNKASLISKIKLNIDLLKLQEKNILTDFPPELTEFEEFIMCSGPTGGWEEYDHKLFLKYRNKFQTQDIFLKQLSKHIIGKSYENIEEHEKWYKEYLEKKQKKQTAILNWKIEKEKEQTKKFIYEKEKKLVGMKNNLNDEMIRTKKLKAIALWKLRKEEQQKNNEKNQKQLALQENKLKEKKKKEQISVTGRTDPSRIFQCTTSWKEKLKKDLTHIPVLSYTIQHKAIPEWRKNINAEKVFHKLPC